MLALTEHLMSTLGFMRVRIDQFLAKFFVFFFFFFLHSSIFVFVSPAFWSCRPLGIVTFWFMRLLCYAGIFCYLLNTNEL